MKYKDFEVKTDFNTFRFYYASSRQDKPGEKSGRLLAFCCDYGLDDLLEDLSLHLVIKCLQQISKSLETSGFTDIMLAVDTDSDYDLINSVDARINAHRHETDDEVQQRVEEDEAAKKRKKAAKASKKERDAVRAKHKAETKEKEERELYAVLQAKYGDKK